MSVDDLDLDDLLAALQSVASSSEADSDSDMDPNDDPDNGDFDPNDDPNDVDTVEEAEDDPRSYEDDDDDNDVDGDYASRSTVMRLRRLETDARKFKLPRGIAATKRLEKPVSKADQNIQKVAQLRSKTQEINYEMESRKLLATATKEHKGASLAFYLANRTPEQTREHEADMQRIAYYYSGICKDVSPNWREDATAEFGSRYRR